VGQNAAIEYRWAEYHYTIGIVVVAAFAGTAAVLLTVTMTATSAAGTRSHGVLSPASTGRAVTSPVSALLLANFRRNDAIAS